jgi:hypothetical protein
MTESPGEDKKEDMYYGSREHGLSLHDTIRNSLMFNQASRERLQDPDRRDTEIHNIVQNWRKNQIDHTDFKTKAPDMGRQSIIKHASKWFRNFVKKDMGELDIPTITKKQMVIPAYVAEHKGRGWFGQTEAHSRASRLGWKTRRKNLENRKI